MLIKSSPSTKSITCSKAPTPHPTFHSAIFHLFSPNYRCMIWVSSPFSPTQRSSVGRYLVLKKHGGLCWPCKEPTSGLWAARVDGGSVGVALVWKCGTGCRREWRGRCRCCYWRGGGDVWGLAGGWCECARGMGVGLGSGLLVVGMVRWVGNGWRRRRNVVTDEWPAGWRPEEGGWWCGFCKENLVHWKHR